MPSRDLDQLLHAFREDNDKLDDLFHAATRYCRTTASRLGSDDPDDVAQQAVHFLWKQSSTIHGRVPCWLRSVILRIILMDRRATERRLPTAEMPESEDSFLLCAGDEPTRNAMTILDPHLRAAAGLLLEGFTAIEAAELTGMKLSFLRWRALLAERRAA